MGKDGFYAVQNGRDGKGIYTTWGEAKAQTNGYSNNVHQKFSSVNDAFKFASSNDGYAKSSNSNKK